MTRDPRAYLVDVIEAGTAIQDALATISFDDYCSTRLICSAEEREFMIIGEALKQLSQQNPKLFASIGQGPEIIGFRNKLTHETITINNHLVWGSDSIGASRSDRALSDAASAVGDLNGSRPMAKAEATVEELVSKIERGELRLPEMQQPWAHTWTNLKLEVEPSMRIVNVHEAKTQFSRLIDAAHAGETILVAKDGKPWARLVPLEPAQPRRQPGVLRGLLQLPSTEELLAPLLSATRRSWRSGGG